MRDRHCEDQFPALSVLDYNSASSSPFPYYEAEGLSLPSLSTNHGVLIDVMLLARARSCGSMVRAGGLTAFVDLTQEATPAKAFVVVCAAEYRRNETRRAMKNIRPQSRATSNQRSTSTMTAEQCSDRTTDSNSAFNQSTMATSIRANAHPQVGNTIKEELRITPTHNAWREGITSSTVQTLPLSSQVRRFLFRREAVCLVHPQLYIRAVSELPLLFMALLSV